MPRLWNVIVIQNRVRRKYLKTENSSDIFGKSFHCWKRKRDESFTTRNINAIKIGNWMTLQESKNDCLQKNRGYKYSQKSQWESTKFSQK